MIPLGVLASARVGGWTPASLPNLRLWLDADDSATFAYSSGVLVSQWSDKSGNAKHAGQSTVGKQPSRSGTTNGRPSVVFDGTRTMFGPLISSATDNFAIFACLHQVGEATGYPNVVAPVYNGTALSNGYGPATRANSPTKGGWLSGGIAWRTCNFNATSPVVLCLQRASGTATVYVDGSADSITFTAAPIAPTGSYWLGAPSDGAGGVGLFNGKMCEVIFYDAALTTTDRQAVETYLKTKWGTP